MLLPVTRIIRSDIKMNMMDRDPENSKRFLAEVERVLDS